MNGARRACAWEQRKLEELYIQSGSGGTPTASNSAYYDGSIPFLSIADIEARDITSTKKTLTELGLQNSTAWLVPAGAVALAMYASVGKVGIIRQNTATSQAFFNMVFESDVIRDFVYYRLEKAELFEEWEPFISTGTQRNLNAEKVQQWELYAPGDDEMQAIGSALISLDNLITLHQRDHRTARIDSPAALILVSFSLREPPNHEEGEESSMLSQLTKDDLLCTYYREWIAVYKEGAVRQVTLNKYSLALAWVERLAPELTLGQLDRIAYQGLLNQYAKTHERQTTMDFHHQLKGAILDAVDEGLVPRDPTRKAIVKGKPPRPKKSRYLNQFELHKLLASLDLGQDIGWEWFILLVAKTGLRFSEALAVTPADFDFSRQTLSVSKTWDYKNGGGFVPTKNRSSVRKVQIDWQLIVQFSVLIKGLPEDKPMFVKDDRKVYNSTANDVLARLCRKAEVPVISIHGLRHTHASLLLFAGVSIASVAKRLGHASMNTTEKTYLHIIQELENKDVDLVMRSLTSLV